MMSGLLLNRVSFVWLLLMIATAMSWGMAALSLDDFVGNSSVMVLFIAFFKVRLVIMYFMEARHAPPVIRWGAEFAVSISCALVISFFIYGSELVDAGFPVG